jgi:hypothetical protein
LAYGVDFFVVYDQDGNNKNALIEELSLKNKNYSFNNSFESVIGSEKLYMILDKIEKMDVSKLDKEIKDCLEKINKFLGN